MFTKFVNVGYLLNVNCVMSALHMAQHGSLFDCDDTECLMNVLIHGEQ